MKTEIPDLSVYPQEAHRHMDYPTPDDHELHCDWTTNDDNPREPQYPTPDQQILICYSRRIEFWDRYMREKRGDDYS